MLLNDHPHSLLMGDLNTLPDHSIRNAYNLKQIVHKATGGKNAINSLLDCDMPLYKSKRCPTDRPWITTHFMDLVGDRRNVCGAGNMELYKQLINKVNRLNYKLKANYYKNVVEKLQTSDSKEMVERYQGTHRKQCSK